VGSGLAKPATESDRQKRKTWTSKKRKGKTIEDPGGSVSQSKQPKEADRTRERGGRGTGSDQSKEET
jgi:hypothetical protein